MPDRCTIRKVQRGDPERQGQCSRLALQGAVTSWLPSSHRKSQVPQVCFRTLGPEPGARSNQGLSVTLQFPGGRFIIGAGGMGGGLCRCTGPIT